MSVRLLTLLLMIVAMVGCSTQHLYDVDNGAAVSLNRAPILGVVLDENQQVVDVWQGGAAEAIGLNVGDVLLDLTWVSTETPVASETPIVSETPITSETPVILEGTEGAAEVGVAAALQNGDVVTEIPGIPAPTVAPEQYMDSTPVPFTDPEGIVYLTTYGLPLRLRFERAGEILEMMIVPNASIFRALELGESTPTPAPDYLFYY